MADSDKTEKPTPKKLEDARKKGQVFRSAEVTSSTVFSVLLAALAMGGGLLFAQLCSVLSGAFDAVAAADFWPALQAYALHCTRWLALFVGALFLATAVLAAGMVRMQVGSVFSFDPLMPKLERVNPASGLKRLFSLKTFVTFGLNLLKTALVLALVYRAVRGAVPQLVRIPHAGSAYQGMAVGYLALSMMGAAAFVYAAFAALDFVMQRFWFMRDMKMARHEVTRESKETQGNPEIKMQRRAMAQEMAYSEQVRSEVKSSDVVVVNPTHFAVAIRYRPGQTPLPLVTAKGMDDMAAAIRRMAHRHGIPVVRDVGLARALFESTAVDHYIGRELFVPVARLLLWVRQLEGELPPHSGD